MPLFPDVERTQSGPIRPTQNPYSFFARSDWSETGRIRKVLEDWFSRYPQDQQSRLRQGFRHNFQDTFFELLVHELLRRTEADVEVHPTLDTAPNTEPDFRVTRKQGTEYIVEATVATDESDQETGLRRIQEELTERLAELEFPGWAFDVTFSRLTSQAESVASIGHFLRKRLETVDREAVQAAYERHDFDAVPEFTYESEKVKLRFHPIPVSYDTHGGNEWSWGSIGAMSEYDEAQVVIPGAGIGDKIERKRPGRYGEFDFPYVVAVNATARFIPTVYDVRTALFGTLAYQFDSSGGGQAIRRADGVWHAPRGPKHTRISAVLVGLMVGPFTVANAEVWFVKNPWAQHEYEGALDRLPRIEFQDRRLLEREGESLGEVLGLPEGWPREEG